MALSIFLAKFLGLYFLIIGILVLIRKDHMLRVIRSVFFSETLLFYSGIISLILGLAIFIGHPIFELSWRGLITLLGLITVSKGILRTGYTDKVMKFFSSLKEDRIYKTILIFTLVLGSYLTLIGFAQG